MRTRSLLLAGAAVLTFAGTPCLVSPGASAAAASAGPTTAVAAPSQQCTPNGLACTPYLGWNTYYGLGGQFNEQVIESVADAIVNRGLKAAGYQYVWIDGGWWNGSRDANGNITVDPKQWPDGMKAMADYIHAKGLLAGIYTDAGAQGCGGNNQGSYGHYQQDADQFAAWGFDALKVDFCGGSAMGLDPATAYGQFSQALRNNSSHRPMLLNICNPLVPEFHGVPYDRSAYVSYTFGPDTGNAWRTYSDIGFSHSIQWPDVLRNYDKNALHPEAAGPGHWNDPDYLGPELGMTAAEAQAQFSLWAVAAAPLIVGSDVRALSQQSITMLTNANVLAIDQDPLGVQGTRVSQQGQGDVWVKPLANGDRAVALLNRGATPLTIGTTAAAIGLPSAASYSLHDLWSGARTETAATIARTVPPNSAVLLRVTPGVPADIAPDTVLSAPNVPATPGSDRLLVVPGTGIPVGATFQNNGREPAIDAQVSLDAPTRWTITGGPSAQTIPAESSITGSWRLTPPAGALPGMYQITLAATYRWGGSHLDTRTSQVTVQVPSTPPGGTEYLSNHAWIEGTSGWMVPRLNHEVGGGPVRMQGQVYAHGIGTASVSRVEYYLGSNCTALHTTIGIDDAVNFDPTGATVDFQLYGDGRRLYDSGTVDRHATKDVSVNVSGVNVLALVVGDAGDGTYNDRADWAEPQLTCDGPPATVPNGPWPHYAANVTASASSANNGYPGSNAIDGDLTTLWHSEFSPVHAPLPVSLTIDLGSDVSTYGFTYQPRLDGTSTGTITSYEIEASTDGATFTPIASGSWLDDSSLKSVSFEPTTARFVRLVADAGDGGYASAAEVQAALLPVP